MPHVGKPARRNDVFILISAIVSSGGALQIYLGQLETPPALDDVHRLRRGFILHRAHIVVGGDDRSATTNPHLPLGVWSLMGGIGASFQSAKLSYRSPPKPGWVTLFHRFPLGGGGGAARLSAYFGRERSTAGYGALERATMRQTVKAMLPCRGTAAPRRGVDGTLSEQPSYFR
jgi:hypothetical protein